MSALKVTSPIPNNLKESAISADMLKEKKMRKACVDFEAIILQQMITTMRKSVPKGGLFESSYANETWQSMQDEELTKNIAAGGGIGLGEALYKELTGQTRSSTKE